jgi:hypothetical protein
MNVESIRSKSEVVRVSSGAGQKYVCGEGGSTCDFGLSRPSSARTFLDENPVPGIRVEHCVREERLVELVAVDVCESYTPDVVGEEGDEDGELDRKQLCWQVIENKPHRSLSQRVGLRAWSAVWAVEERHCRGTRFVIPVGEGDDTQVNFKFKAQQKNHSLRIQPCKAT